MFVLFHHAKTCPHLKHLARYFNLKTIFALRFANKITFLNIYSQLNDESLDFIVLGIMNRIFREVGAVVKVFLGMNFINVGISTRAPSNDCSTAAQEITKKKQLRDHLTLMYEFLTVR